MLIGRATCAYGGRKKHRGTKGTPMARKVCFSSSKQPSLPAVVGLSLSLGPSQPQRHQNAQGPHPALHPAVQGRERRGGEEEPGGRRENWRAGRDVGLEGKRGRAERREAVG